MSTTTITVFRYTNSSSRDLTFLLEPEGDEIELPQGQTCEIKTESVPQKEVEYELEIGSDNELTLSLAIVKQVYVNGVQIR